MLFLFLGLTACNNAASQQQSTTLCTTPNHYDKRAIVRHVHDGDTIHLKGGEKVRLLGINTPEIDYKDNQRGQPLGDEAANWLKRRLPKGSAIHLVFDDLKKDRHGRTLAYLFSNQEDIQLSLIKQGLAETLIIPPNTDRAHCYTTAERQAKLQKAGLWAHTYYAPKQTLTQQGKTRITGTVDRVSNANVSIVITLNNGLQINVSPKHARHFSSQWLNTLTGREIYARGYAQKQHDSWVLYIQHPSQIITTPTR